MIRMAGKMAAVVVLVASGGLVLTPIANAGPQLDRCLRSEAPGISDLEFTRTQVGVQSNPKPGVALEPGEAVLVMADPATKVQIETPPWSEEYNPMGTGVASDEFPVPGAPRYGLIGGPIGGPQDSFQFLGLTFCYENTSNNRETFWLSINDTKVSDNHGGWNVAMRLYRPTPEPVQPRFGVPTAPNPALAMSRCQRGELEQNITPTPWALNGGNGWAPVRFTLQPGAVYRARAVDSSYHFTTSFGTVMPGGRKPPSIRVGPWPWDGVYGPNGAGWSDLASADWPAPGVPKYGLIGAWEGLPGYYWVGGEAPCIQWTGSTPVSVALTMNDPNIGDNDGGWQIEVSVYSPYYVPEYRFG